GKKVLANILFLEDEMIKRTELAHDRASEKGFTEEDLLIAESDHNHPWEPNNRSSARSPAPINF
ncbi:hypothetical protein HAX54_014704, partial [Datura stramonium]|nr:hypothetical protein [Datura stramonium]